MLADDERIKMMVEKLTGLSARGQIDDEWTKTFIWDIQKRVLDGIPLTERQTTKIEELYEEY